MRKVSAAKLHLIKKKQPGRELPGCVYILFEEDNFIHILVFASIHFHEV